MEENKQDTIAKLYALRAGLSTLSEIADEGRRVQQQINQLNRIINESKDRIEKIQNDVSERRDSNIAKKKQAYLNEIKSKENELEKLKKDNILSFGARIFTVIFGIACLVVGIICFRASFAGRWDGMVILEKVFLLIIAGGGILYFIASIGLIYSHYNVKKQIPTFEKNLEKMHQEQDTVFAQYEKDCPLEVTGIPIIQENINQTQGKLELETEKLPPIYARFHATYQATQEQFCSFLDERDWGNVDLIIFNYETGRALDMRDALMQVDNERRNERLIKAVRDASAAICSSIRRGFGALQTTIENQTHMLDNRIASLSSQFSENASRQSEMIAGAVAEISSTQQALINKSNISSDTMAEDVGYMRQLADINYYHR